MASGIKGGGRGCPGIGIGIPGIGNIGLCGAVADMPGAIGGGIGMPIIPDIGIGGALPGNGRGPPGMIPGIPLDSIPGTNPGAIFEVDRGIGKGIGK